MPMVLLGYDRDIRDNALGINTDETILELLITLDPPLPQPPIISLSVINTVFRVAEGQFNSDEDANLLRVAAKWQKRVESYKRTHTVLFVERLK